MLNDITRAKNLQTSDPLQGVDKWSELVRKYKNAAGKTPSDSVKITVLQNMCPKGVETHLQLDARRQEGTPRRHAKKARQELVRSTPRNK